MKFTVKIFFISFLAFLPLVAYANQATFDACPNAPTPPSYYCDSGLKFIAAQCRTYASVSTTIDSCTDAKKDQYSCGSNSCVCQSAYPNDCRSASLFLRCVTNTEYNTDPNGCAVAHKDLPNKCTKVCGDCVSPYESDGAGGCRAACAAGETRIGADCVGWKNVASLALNIPLAQIESTWTAITGYLTGNNSYYVLTATGTGVPATVRDYKYASDRDNVWLEADKSDNLNWGYTPEPLKTILERLSGVRFCATASDCATGQTCDYNLCSGGNVALGDACDEVTTFCIAGLVCNANICADPVNTNCTTDAQCGNPAQYECVNNNCYPKNHNQDSSCVQTSECNYGLVCTGTPLTCQPAPASLVDPATISPGVLNQVLTTVNNAGTLTSVWQSPSSASVFVGLTNGGYTSDVSSYLNMNTKCNAAGGALTGSHVCTPDEILASYNQGVAAALSETGIGIINNGPPGYTVYANDCNGWKVRSDKYNGAKAFGAAWYFTEKNASLVRCDWLADTAGKPNYKIACCK